ncbi:DsrE family protein [Marinobacter santoriniensis NKSG1]|jgi:tRNA 2-thiouridine synthesizing protein C|uniref:DsrE family protein n=1 Tax=Marinobacter santoriniensis NKSG1 TaxID=1288826 RepID=M7CP98_9GAMM|nr:DsrE family protein [Marinobacter santoriniensis]EMP55461.1 DsrE family protein [Marinobacter santoriniensis NKSG1]
MSTLVVIDSAPYGDWTGREALDMAFSLAAFDQPVTLLFLGAGVNWLRKGQAPEGISQKSVEKNLSAAPIFGVEGLLADGRDCEAYGLAEADLIAGVTRVDVGSDLLHQYTHTVFAG